LESICDGVYVVGSLGKTEAGFKALFEVLFRDPKLYLREDHRELAAFA